MDAGALDDLDLDGMFADDNDMLFEGLDIQMEGMGDIISTTPGAAVDPLLGGGGEIDNSAFPTAAEVRRGPRTRRPPPPSAAENTGSTTKTSYEADGITPKRRKTKRKSKTPAVFGENDDDFAFEDGQSTQQQQQQEQQPPKKRTKKSKAGASSTSGTGATANTGKKTKKSKSKKPLISLPTSGKASSSSSTTAGGSTVAAAGRFGKRGGGSTTKATKRKAGVSKSEETSGPAPLFSPKQESTFGGLAPSSTQFYPFLENVPPEPSLKSRKQFPQLDKIFAIFNAYLGAATGSGKGAPVVPNLTAATEANLSMESPIMQLLIDSFEGISERDKAAFGDLRKQTLLASIPQVRTAIRGLDSMKVLSDLYSMCGLLMRQYNFVQTSLNNMETWCRSEFSDSDFRQAFSLPEPFKPEKVGTIITASNRKWKAFVINVKVTFAGHREIKGTPTLQAKMPSMLVTPDKKKTETKSKKAKTKEKSSSAPKTGLSTPKTTSAPRSYSDLTPADRRQKILEKVGQLALTLESQLSGRRSRFTVPTSSISSTSPKGSTPSSVSDSKPATLSATYIPPEEPPLHTARMWEWLNAANFFRTTPLSDGQLRLQSPEMNPRGHLLPTPTRIQGRKESNNKHSPDCPTISSNGLYDRLQSLLVDENDCPETDINEAQTEYSSDWSSDTDGENDDLDFLDEDTDDEYDDSKRNDKCSRPLLDLSQLSIEERAFLHLRSVGLIKSSTFPQVELILEEKDDTVEDDLVNVIGDMSADLCALTARNNARLRYLDSVIDPVYLADRKQLEDEQHSLSARYQSLLKRSKEKSKKSTKQKSNGSSAKDDLNLPW